MNAERLHSVCLKTNLIIRETSLISKLDTLVKSFTNTVNQPQQPNHQQELAQNLDTLYKTLSEFPTNEYSPAWNQVLSEIGAIDLLGSRLETTIRGIFERNAITPAAALEEVKTIVSKVHQLNSAIDNIMQGFKALHIGSEKLQPGECEVGILVPRDSVHSDIRELGKELQDLNLILGTFSEVASGRRDTFEIKTISSSELMFFLSAIPAVAACVAHAAGKIISTYKDILEIKKLKTDLENQGFKEKEVAFISKRADDRMNETIDELLNEIFGDYCSIKDKGRINELKKLMRSSLKKLAVRIDKGFNIDVRVEPPEESIHDDEEEDGVKDQEQLLLRRHIQTVADASESLQFMKPTPGRILSFSEDTNDDNDTPGKRKEEKSKPSDE